MIELLARAIFSWAPLRQAMFDEVHFYDEIDRVINEPTTNLTWEEGGLWYGYTYNEMHKTYLFDDTGHEDMTTLWDSLWTRDMEWGLMYK
jgi:hypothetical protein